MLKRLWADEGGAILSAELILIMTILVIGLIVGLKALQAAVVTELADIASAIGALDQGYSFSGTTQDAAAGCILAQTAGSKWVDAADQGDEETHASGNSQFVIVCSVTPSTTENSNLSPL